MSIVKVFTKDNPVPEQPLSGVSLGGVLSLLVSSSGVEMSLNDKVAPSVD